MVKKTLLSKKIILTPKVRWHGMWCVLYICGIKIQERAGETKVVERATTVIRLQAPNRYPTQQPKEDSEHSKETNHYSSDSSIPISPIPSLSLSQYLTNFHPSQSQQQQIHSIPRIRLIRLGVTCAQGGDPMLNGVVDDGLSKSLIDKGGRFWE